MLRILVVLSLLAGSLAAAQTYTGPKSIGPYTIQHDTPVQTLFEMIGKPARLSSDYYCYVSADRSTFLVLIRMAGMPTKVGEVMLSDFQNCVNKPLQVTKANLQAWKSKEGIGLGSSKEEVIETYGSPSSQESIGYDYRSIILGAPAHSKKKPEVGTTILSYRGTRDDLSAACFGIRDGKVAWLFLSYNE
jgi:hypothetical protein